MKNFTLINKERNRIKVFELFEDVSKPSLSINAILQRADKALSSDSVKIF